MADCDSLAGRVTVATGGCGEIMATWLDGWEMSPAARRRCAGLVAYRDDTWTDALAGRFAAAGFDVRDGGRFMREWKLRNIANPDAYAPMRNPGYGGKTSCVLDAGRGSDWVLWFDQDVWVRGDPWPWISRAVAAMDGADSSAWFAAPKYRSLGPASPFYGRVAAQHGAVLCRAGDPRAAKWLDATMAGGNDETAFVDAFGGIGAAEREVFDLYDPAFYEGTLRDGPGGEGVERVRRSAAAVLHYSGGYAKRAFFEDVSAARRAWDCASVDAVFPLGAGSAHGDAELRYALRSLDLFCPFVRNVYVVGERPAWLRCGPGAARHIPWPDRFDRDKDANIIDKVLRACMEPGAADALLVCSDDQFATRPMAAADFAPRFLPAAEAEAGTDWMRRLRETMARFACGARFFRPHAWSPVSRAEFMRMCASMDWRRESACKTFTLYYNFVGERGAPDGGDSAFVAGEGGIPRGAAQVGYDDSAFDRPEFRAELEAMFPAKSRFEA